MVADKNLIDNQHLNQPYSFTDQLLELNENLLWQKK